MIERASPRRAAFTCALLHMPVWRGLPFDIRIVPLFLLVLLTFVLARCYFPLSLRAAAVALGGLEFPMLVKHHNSYSSIGLTRDSKAGHAQMPLRGVRRSLYSYTRKRLSLNLYLNPWKILLLSSLPPLSLPARYRSGEFGDPYTRGSVSLLADIAPLPWQILLVSPLADIVPFPPLSLPGRYCSPRHRIF